jgi:hypothetical protein
MSQDKKNQHYVPQAHLRGFTVDGEKNLIWEYDKKYQRISKTHRSIRSLCCKEYYYEQVYPDGSKTQILEDGFQKVEKVGIEIIRDIISKKNLTEDERGKLSFYIALLLTRGPSFRDGIHSILKHHVDITTQKMWEMGKLPEPPEELKKLIRDNDITSVLNAEILPHVSIEYFAKAAEQIAISLCNKKWDIYFSENGYFITSDTPVIFEGPLDESRGGGPAHIDSLVLCPLTKDVLLAARPYHSSDVSPYEYKSARGEMIESVNKFMCFVAQRFLYVPEKSNKILEYVKMAIGFKQSLSAFRIGDAVIYQWRTDMNVE